MFFNVNSITFARKDAKIMKKRLLALLLIACTLVMTLAGCSTQLYKYDSYDEYIILGSLEGVEINQSDIDDSIMNAYNALFTSSDATEKEYTSADTDVTVINGDTVTIDYVGTMDGVAFEGGTANDQTLVIGSGSFIDGFEDGLKGHGAGEKVVLDLTFPNPYPNNPDYAGKPAQFTVTIDKIKRTEYPEYNDENVKKYSDGEYETVAAFEEGETPDIIKNLLWNSYYTTCKIKKYPEKELKEYYESSIESVKSTAAMFGMTLSGFVTAYYGYSDVKSFYQSTASSAQSAVKNDLIVLALVEKMPELKLSEADYEVALKELYDEQVEVNGYGGTYKDFLKEYEDISLEISVYSKLIMEKLEETKVIVDDVTKNGFVSDRNGMRYYVDGEYLKGWTKLDVDGQGEKDYYFDKETGYAPAVCALIAPKDGGAEKFLEFTEKGQYVGLYSGIFKDGVGARYFVDGEMKKGVISLELNETVDGEESYYFDNTTGYMAISVAVGPDGKYHDFGDDGIDKGVVPDGLVGDVNGIRYFKDGAYITGWIEDKIDADKDGNFEKYYFDKTTGFMCANSAFEIDGKYYTFDKEGVYLGVSHGLVKDDKGTRLFKEGALQLGLQEYTTDNDVKNTYFFKPEEGYAMIEGWYTEENNGEMVNKFYFDENGYKVVNKTVKIDGKDVKFDENGNVTE